MDLDAETGLHYVSYVTSGESYSVVKLGLLPARPKQRKAVRRTLGFGMVVRSDAALYVGCRDAWRSAGQDGGPVKEGFSVANASGRQYKWNYLHAGKVLGEICG